MTQPTSKRLITEASGAVKYATKAVERGRFPAFAPKLPIVVTSDAPTITYTDHTSQAPFATLVLPTDPRLTFHGWVAGTRNVSGNSTWINLANGWATSTDYATLTQSGTYSPYEIEFDYYGTGLALNTIGLQATYSYQVYVDGLPVSATPLAMDPAHTGNSYGQYASLTWGTAKLRRIRFRMPSNIALKGIRVGLADSLSPAKKSATKVFVLGDSWVEATGADSTFTGFSSSLGLLTGWEIYRAGQAGTGYVNPASGNFSAFGSSARRQPIKDVKPDYLIVAGTSNDDANSATVGAAAAALYAAVATDTPNTKIIVVGPQLTGSTLPANRDAVRSAIIAAANAAPNVIGVIDPITAQWITGSGKTGINRTVTDGVTTASSTTITSATAAFVTGDVGRVISGGTIPANATISSVTNSTTAVLSAACTSSASGVTFNLTSQRLDGNADVFVYTDGAHPVQAGHDYWARQILAALPDSAL